MSSSRMPPRQTSNKFMLRVLSASAAVLIPSLGIGITFLWYISHANVKWTTNELITTVPQGNVLLITTVISKIILTLVPVTLGVAAYSVANDWMRASKNPESNPTKNTLPTPYQYNLLLRIFQGASLSSLWTTIQYLAKSTSTSRSGTSRQLTQAFSILLVALFLAYGLVGIDFALHSLSTTRSTLLDGKPLDTNSISNLSGRKLRDECNHPNVNESACTMTRVSIGRQSVDLKEGYLVLTDLSASNSISISSSTADNGSNQQIALLTDPNPPGDISFTAQTIGVSTKCDILTQTCDPNNQCTDDFHPPSTHLRGSLPCGRYVAFPCIAENWPRYWVTGALQDSSTIEISETLESRNEPELVDMQFKLSDPSTGRNPFHIIVQLPAYVDPNLLNDVCAEKSASGVCIRDRDPGYMYYGGTSIEAQHYRVSVMGCTITVVNVGYTYYNGTYIVDQPTVRLADNATTWAVGSVLYGEKPPVSFITNAANALASSGGESSALAKVIEERLSRLLLALSHSAFEMSPILTLSSRQTLLVTVLPTYIVVAFFGFLVVFAAFVVVLTIMALTSSREALVIAGNTQSQSDDVVNAVEIAKQRLCEPAGLIYQVFEGKTGQEEGEDRWAKEGIEIFLEGQDPQRRWGTMVDGRDVKVGLDEDGLFGFQ